MRPIKLENKELVQAVNEGKEPYVQVGSRKFLLFEVDQATESDVYEVTDPAEKKKLLDALEKENPILTDAEINKMLRQSH